MEDILHKVKNCNTVEGAIELLESSFPQNQKINKAISLACQFHEGQFRKSKEPYVVHPILVAVIVSHLGGDEEMVVSAILHDTIEDTHCNTEDIRDNFGQDICNLVEGLTKIDEIRDENLAPSTSDEKLVKSALSFRKMLIASIVDFRVLVIKLCDRLHNMLTLGVLSEQKQRRISEETLLVYAPIAHRLGISMLKNLLEDLSFYYVLPDEYQKIDKFLDSHEQQLQLLLNSFISKINQLMLKNGFTYDDFSIQKRVKHHYSIYLKMQRKGISIEEVLDLLAIRILVKEPIDCYRALGIIHLNFNPLISRFKDYVAIPKENGYQTIHTTVFNEKSIIEAQIRTYNMNKTAEYGIAAHWKYKSGGLMPKLDWLNSLGEAREEDNLEDFVERARGDLFSEDIAVFSPKGDIFTLPRGATALDFAYAIHTDLGNKTKEAFINKQKTPLLTELKNGDIVKIIAAQEPISRCSWISSVKTSKAKSSISFLCRQKLRELQQKVSTNILTTAFGVDEEVLNRWLEAEHIKKGFKIAIDSPYLVEVSHKLQKYPLKERRIFPLLKFDKYKIKKQKFDNIVIYSNFNISNVLFDYCCHPKRGDAIIGLKKGSEVIVHHAFCEQASKMIENKEPTIFVKWSKDIPSRYKLIVTIENKKGSLASFLTFLTKLDVNVVTISLGKSEESAVDYFELIIEVPEGKENLSFDKIKERYKVILYVPVDDAYKEIKGSLYE